MIAAVRRHRRTLAIVAGVLFTGWIAWGVVHAGGDVPPLSTGSLTQLDRGVVSGKRVDGKAWSLDYDSMQLGPDGQTANIHGVHHGRIERDGKPYLAVRAQDVSANQISGDFSVRGPVTFDEIDGKHQRKIVTSDAAYVSVTHRLELPNEVRIESDGGTLVVAKASLDFRSGDLHLGRIVVTR